MTTRALALPYAHLNLRRNPFGERTPEERVALAVVDVTPWVETLRTPRGSVQFVGESGRGKTTRLLALRKAFPDAAWVRVPETGTVDLPDAPVLFVDEVQHLPRRVRRDLFARPASLALGTHVDFAHALRRAGRHPVTVPLRGLSTGLLCAMVDARIEAARRAPGPVPVVPTETLRALIAAHGDDVRAIEGRLYDAIQAMEGPGHVEV